MKIEIDRKRITALPDDTIMAAARRADIFIPGMCYSDAAEKSNCCRLCMVEVDKGGRTQLVAACAFKVQDGLKVTTDSDRILRIRKTLLRLLYAQAPDNPAIMALMETYGIKPERRFPLKIDSGQCILCRLCTANCKALGKSAISPVDRGVAKRIDTPYGRPAEDCLGCGSCAEVCPTGCIEIIDTKEKRIIWNKEFSWIRCECCDAIITTKEHFEASAQQGDPVLCPACRRKKQADVFAETLGERF